MIPTEVEIRIARYVFHKYLPDEVMKEIEDKLLPACIWDDEEHLDHDELVRWAIEIIDRHWQEKRFK
ncbi:hypothetical protein [Niallia sp. MER TA 168]|uniref:hypothetical protein n=1 Tax=Niallia sp. MER TA 168 TaxID=2939568 RepID=UPI00203DF9E5|nr:hypothetical protein [Niallia sp. MER TA 168]MCM3362536.1 hypothetical protein [Niallia sp. MER TA 168]